MNALDQQSLQAISFQGRVAELETMNCFLFADELNHDSSFSADIV
jgi:hypothetical protein